MGLSGEARSPMGGCVMSWEEAMRVALYIHRQTNKRMCVYGVTEVRYDYLAPESQRVIRSYVYFVCEARR